MKKPSRFLDFLPIVEDVMNDYTIERKNGITRENALNHIKTIYSKELTDFDDKPQVIIGVSLALCKKNELTEELLHDCRKAIDELRQRREETVPKQIIEYLLEYVSEGKIGTEAKYRSRNRYDPGWKIGDTFMHHLVHNEAESLGLKDWNILFRKVGEYQDRKKNYMQVVYVTVCPPDKMPTTNEEMNRLGLIRMMKQGNRYDYLGHLFFRSVADEKAWGLTKIGNFPHVIIPSDATEEDPAFAMPILGVLKKGDLPDYEDLVCHLVKFLGFSNNRFL